LWHFLLFDKTLAHVQAFRLCLLIPSFSLVIDSHGKMGSRFFQHKLASILIRQSPNFTGISLQEVRFSFSLH